MSKKLSELDNNTILLVGEARNYIINKGEYVKESQRYAGEKVYTAMEYHPTFNVIDMVGNAIEQEAANMYEGWVDEILKDVTAEDLIAVQCTLDRVLNRHKYTSYIEDEEVEIDI